MDVQESDPQICTQGWEAGTIRIAPSQAPIQAEDIQLQKATIAHYIRKKPSKFNAVNFNFPNILNSICFSKADLSSLIRLDVSGNSIENIDIIDRVSAPHLKELRIQNNRIIAVRPVRKCFWPHLQWLNLENNPLKDTAFLAELKCHQNFQWLTFHSDPSMNFAVFKLEPKMIHCINHNLHQFGMKQQPAALQERYKRMGMDENWQHCRYTKA